MRWDFPIFRQHGIEEQLLSYMHRFRVVGRNYLLELAKDAARLPAGRIVAESLQRFTPVTLEMPRTGSLKSLERALARREAGC